MIRFTKAHGLGNDFVILDRFTDSALPAQPLDALARAMCDRRRGVGADQLLTIEPPTEGGRRDGAALRMRVFNADGGEAEMCGNGVRCVAQIAHARGLFPGSEGLIETLSGARKCEILSDGRVRVSMGRPDFSAASVGFEESAADAVERRGRLIVAVLDDLRGGLVAVGTPNFVSFAEAPVSLAFATHRGAAVEAHPCFPKRINVQFATRTGRDRVEVRTWERGAGLTEACGTGACAVFAVGREQGLIDSPAAVVLPGGALRIEEGAGGEVLKTGPTTVVYHGDWGG